MHFVRCPVSVHQFPKANLGVSYQGRLLARYDATGGILSIPQNKERAASAHRLASIKTLAGAAHRTGWREPEISSFSPALPSASEFSFAARTAMDESRTA